MLELNLPAVELFDNATQVVTSLPARTVHLEHSLFSLSKWESFYHVPFLNTTDKTNSQMFYYICCMVQEPHFTMDNVRQLSSEDHQAITDYINNPMTATTVTSKSKNDHTIITAEVIYSMMCDFGIPFTCEHWHLNRLMMLLKVKAAQNSPKEKVSAEEMHDMMRSRRAQIKAQLAKQQS